MDGCAGASIFLHENGVAFCLGEALVEGGEALGEGAIVPFVVDGFVDSFDSDDFPHRACAKDFVCVVNLFFGNIADGEGDLVFGAEFDDCVAGDSGGASLGGGGGDHSVFD